MKKNLCVPPKSQWPNLASWPPCWVRKAGEIWIQEVPYAGLKQTQDSPFPPTCEALCVTGQLEATGLRTLFCLALFSLQPGTAGVGGGKESWSCFIILLGPAQAWAVRSSGSQEMSVGRSTFNREGWVGFQRSFHNPPPSSSDFFLVPTKEIFLGSLKLITRFFRIMGNWQDYKMDKKQSFCTFEFP